MSKIKVNVADFDFVTNDGKIDIDSLSSAFTSILNDAEKANNGKLAAARRFRTNTVKLSKEFLLMRNVTPKPAVKK